MTSLSPRGSISTGMANVAEDFEESLRDLQQNNRYEISNLTLIAKESTEHAQAISKALEVHIRTTAPNRKLPALYVLDSIVKNVGTPYTVYLSRNLYSTFMEAYTLVDGMTRRSMEGMLRTWKEPVPGSLDPRPVFPLETVRPIENALLKAKTAALQSQRNMTPQPPYRGTPTPPQFMGQNGQQAQFYGYPQQQQQLFPAASQPTMFPSSTPLQNQYRATPPPSQLPQDEYSTVLQDTQNLITTMQGQFAANPADQALITKLQALLQLQQILKTQAQTLRPTDLQQIKSQISSLSTTAMRVSTPVPSTPQLPTAMPPVQPFYPPGFNPQSSMPMPGSNQIPASILAPGALDSLQALLANTNKPSTPQIRSAIPALQSASHTQLAGVQNQVAGASQLNSMDLLAALAKNNLLPAAPIPTPAQASSFAPSPSAVPSISGPNQGSTEALLASIKQFLPPIPQISTPPAITTSGQETKPRIPITAAALKIFRPELVRGLYDAQPNQCNNCGRRFLATDDGREKKSRHLDWHFRTNQRMADASTNRGHHRNWFVDEMAWIRLTEYDPSTTTAEEAARLNKNSASASDGSALGGLGVKRVEDSFVRAPTGMTVNTCSICYEEMKSSYNENVQDWVFTNAVTSGSKIVHATCADEIRRANPIQTSQTSVLTTATLPAAIPIANPSALAAALAGLTGTSAHRATTPRSRSGTPDSALGKRKATGVLPGNPGVRMKVE